MGFGGEDRFKDPLAKPTALANTPLPSPPHSFRSERVFTRLARSAEETPFARRRFFEQIGGCRRRAVGDWAERPIAVALTVPSEPPGEGGRRASRGREAQAEEQGHSVVRKMEKRSRRTRGGRFFGLLAWKAMCTAELS